MVLKETAKIGARPEEGFRFFQEMEQNYLRWHPPLERASLRARRLYRDHRLRPQAGALRADHTFSETAGSRASV